MLSFNPDFHVPPLSEGLRLNDPAAVNTLCDQRLEEQAADGGWTASSSAEAPTEICHVTKTRMGVVEEMA